MASAVGAYASISDQHIYDMEYWPLQKQKTVHSQSEPLQGQVAIVSGAGGIIGYGIADRLLAAGAAVAITDIDEKKLSKVEQFLAEKYSQMRVSSFVCDVTDEVSVGKLYDDLCDRWGGVDIVVPNAGIAHVESLENLDTDKLKQLIDVNLIGSFLMVKKAIPILKRQGSGGNVVLVSSKNVFAPGADFGAYSMTKAGAHQMARIASLELADVGVRVNMVNPDGVFGTENVSSGLWDLIGPDRMKSRNLDPAGLKEYYRNRNQLKVSVSAEHVGNAVVFFASNQTPTTGATLPVDGGVPGAAPR